MMPSKQIISTFNNNVQDSLKGKMALRFRSSFPIESEIAIICSPDDKISDVFEKCKKKANINDNKNQKKFVYSARYLNPLRTVIEEGLFNNSVIFVLDKSEGLRGG